MISARQIKAARAMLDWSREDLAHRTGLSPSTIRNLETGVISPRGSTIKIIQRIIERAGFEFLGLEGVRKLNDDLYVYQGMDSGDLFFDDITRTLRVLGGEVVMIFPSTKTLTELCNLKGNQIARLEALSDQADIKCLLPEALSLSLLNSTIQFRPILKEHINPVPYFIYGNKLALITPEGGAHFQFTVFQSSNLAHLYRDHFITLWDAAPPIGLHPKFNQKQNTKKMAI